MVLAFNKRIACGKGSRWRGWEELSEEIIMATHLFHLKKESIGLCPMNQCWNGDLLYIEHILHLNRPIFFSH